MLLAHRLPLPDNMKKRTIHSITFLLVLGFVFPLTVAAQEKQTQDFSFGCAPAPPTGAFAPSSCLGAGLAGGARDASCDLPALVEANLPITDARSITGHSMGGHGALICALREPGRYRSVSAFAPICHPMACGWGQGCFKAYLGLNREDWVAYDAVRLIEEGALAIPLLIDQGTADEFLAQQLHPAPLERVCAARDFPLTLRWQEGYDHSYHFIATFIGEHLAYHARHLRETRTSEAAAKPAAR